MKETKKSGLVVIVGRSNAGKSTLMNALVGTKVAITSPKPQTTRHTVHGVLNGDKGQVVFVDTPGIFKRVPDLLTRRLNEKARESLEGVDVILYVVDPTRHIGEEEQIVRRMVATAKQPKLLLLNKSDLERPYIDEYLAWSDGFDETIDISAAKGKNLKRVLSAVFERLPEGDLLYPDDVISDGERRFRIAELIREKVFLQVHEELPYSVTVEVAEVADRPDGTLYVRADIITSAERYKRMLIGEGARRIKAIGSASRKEMELVTGRKVFIELEVRVDERWQERFE